jgi:hypothetical protein
MSTTGNTPEWIKSQRRANGDCEQCGQGPQDTQWAGTGELICWTCCSKRQDAYAERMRQS